MVIFDNDGVLVDSERLANQVLAELLGDCSHPVTFDDCVYRFLGGTLDAVRSTVEAERAAPLPPDFEERYHERLFASFRSSLRPVPGVGAVVDRLQRAGVPVCVASSGTHERIRFALAQVGLLDRFGRRIFSAEDVPRGKPAPDLFLHAAASMGVAPERCVVVEDSPAGVAAARAAGMTVVGYVGLTPRPRLEDAGADAVVDSMHALLATLADLPAGTGSVDDPVDDPVA